MLLGVLRFLAGKAIGLRLRRQLRAFNRAVHKPSKLQQKILDRIIGKARNTGFGRDHKFAEIRSVADFRRQIPIEGYEYFEPYMQRVRRGELDALLAERKVHMFALTSGTTNTRKFIPVTPSYLKAYRKGWHIWGIRAYLDHASIKFTPIVQFSGDDDEFRTESGIPCGSVTGLTARMQKRFIRRLYCVPACVGRIKDPAAKYYVTLRLSVAKSVGMIIAANPSTMVNLARLGDQEKEALLKDLHDGTLDSRFAIPDSIRNELAPLLRVKHQARVAELESIIARTGTLYPKDYWRPDCLLGNWTGGSVGAYLRHYDRYYGEKPVRDVGLIASEGRMTIPMDDGTPSGILDVTSHYFEFIPEDEIKDAKPTVLGAHEVVEGKNYFILLTTSYGLYRYHISDVVRVTGFRHSTPTLEFLSKGANFANITGEKLSEYHVTQSMRDVLVDTKLNLSTYSVAPCWDDQLPYYGLFLESGDVPNAEIGMRLATLLDDKLSQINIEYASKRETLRLGSMRVVVLPPGTWGQWDRERLARNGGTLEQYKHPCLIPDAHFREKMPVLREWCRTAKAS